jgi:hypothetical protein
MRKFINHAKYYNFPRPATFINAKQALVTNLHDVEVIQAFMKIMTNKLMSVTYHMNSYLQDDLVDIYATAEAMELTLTKTNEPSFQTSQAALVLFERFVLFKPRLETSLQRGDILYGAFKSGKLKHSQVGSVLMFLWVRLWWPRTSEGGCCSFPWTLEDARKAAASPLKPVAVETIELAAQMHALSRMVQAPLLRREAMDLGSLYHTTQESYVSSLIVVSAWIGMLTGLVFTVGNIGIRVDHNAVWAARR